MSLSSSAVYLLYLQSKYLRQKKNVREVNTVYCFQENVFNRNIFL